MHRRRLDDTPVVSLIVPGGEYSSALELLRDIAAIHHRFKEIGVAAHPEGRPFVSDDTLAEQLQLKQHYPDYPVAPFVLFQSGGAHGGLAP